MKGQLELHGGSLLSQQQCLPGVHDLSQCSSCIDRCPALLTTRGMGQIVWRWLSMLLVRCVDDMPRIICGLCAGYAQA
jgi:hypothetical protein